MFLSLYRRLSRSHLAAQASWLIASGLIQAVIAFVANLVLVRFIAPEGFGRFALTQATIGIALTVVSLRLGTQIIRDRVIAHDEGARNLYFNAILQESVIAGVIAGFGLVFGGLLDWWGILLLLSTLTIHFADNNKNYVEREMRYKQLSIVETGANGGSHVASILFVLIGGGVAALYLREFIYGLVYLHSMVKIGALKWYRPRLLKFEEWKVIIRNARGVWLDAMLENSFPRFVMLLTGMVGGDRGAGFLLQAYRLAGVPHQLLAPIAGRVAFNWFSRETDDANRLKKLQSIIIYMFFPLLGAVFVTMFYANQIIWFLFGDAWIHVGQLLIQLTGLMMFLSFSDLFRVYFIASYRTRYSIIMKILQYLVFGLTAGLFMLINSLSVNEIGLSVSLAYLFMFISGISMVWLHKKKYFPDTVIVD